MSKSNLLTPKLDLESVSADCLAFPFQGIAFVGMIIQLPLIAFTRQFEKAESPMKKMIGNCVFWVTFTICGQPFAALCYFYAWQIKYGSISEKWKSSPGR